MCHLLRTHISSVLRSNCSWCLSVYKIAWLGFLLCFTGSKLQWDHVDFYLNRHYINFFDTHLSLIRSTTGSWPSRPTRPPCGGWSYRPAEFVWVSSTHYINHLGKIHCWQRNRYPGLIRSGTNSKVSAVEIRIKSCAHYKTVIMEDCMNSYSLLIYKATASLLVIALLLTCLRVVKYLCYYVCCSRHTVSLTDTGTVLTNYR